MTTTPDQNLVTKTVQDAINANLHLAGPLLPILHQIQHELRYIPDESVPTIAKALNLSRAEVHGVVTFYHTFTGTAQGEHIIEVCRAESCQSMGGRLIEKQFKEELGIDFQQTTDDGKVTLEAVYCLGNCACSPAVRVGSEVYGRMTSDKVTNIIKKIRSN